MMMVAPLLLVYVVLAIPLTGALILIALGRRLGTPLAGYFGTAVAMATFAATVAMLVAWIEGGSGWGYQLSAYVAAVGWLPVGDYRGQRTPGFLDAAVYLDSLAVLLIAVVSFIAAVVHLFSLAYMRSEARFAYYFACLNFFLFAMLGLLVSGTLLQMLIFWELVGICSYLLIGFHHERGLARAAAIKAFVINRVGDVGFIVGVAIVVGVLGNVTLPDVWMKLHGAGGQMYLTPTMLTVVGVLLACGAIAKSAQFPLHTWLPDAMAGPTPVSALIHAATMVAAGVFLLARIFPILTADARLVLVILGGVTILSASLCALAQRDIKQSLAFSTSAQLGYMVLAIGIGSWTGAMFHLVTHAFAKALLFLCSGTVIHGMHHVQRLERYGGLLRRMPVTAIAFAIGALSLAGAPYLSGYFSKTVILTHAAAFDAAAVDAGRGGLWKLALWIPVIGAYLTPLYLTRLWVLTFLGAQRDRTLYREASEPGILSFPLVLLAGMTVVAGYAWFPVGSMIDDSIKESRGYFASIAPGGTGANVYDAAWAQLPVARAPAITGGEVELTETADEPVPFAEAARREHRYTGYAWLLGLLSGVLLYHRGFVVTDRLARFRPIGAVRHWLAHRMYFDDLYDFVFVGGTEMVVSAALAVDKYLIDPVVNAVGRAAKTAARGVAWGDDRLVDGVVRRGAAAVLAGGGAAALTRGRVR
ncbi:MAG TPA: NADH-quinone oxidoreductase subunit L, partial [Tepidisphaeraceae bacterium]